MPETPDNTQQAAAPGRVLAAAQIPVRLDISEAMSDLDALESRIADVTDKAAALRIGDPFDERERADEPPGPLPIEELFPEIGESRTQGNVSVTPVELPAQLIGQIELTQRLDTIEQLMRDILAALQQPAGGA